MYGDYTSYNPSMFTVRQLDFDASERMAHKRKETMSTCAMVGTVVVLFYLMTLLSPRRDSLYNPMYHNPAIGRYMSDGYRGVHGMLSRASSSVGQVLSARRAIVAESDVFTSSASRFYDKLKTFQAISLVEKHTSQGGTTSLESMLDEDKARCKAALKDYLDATDRVLIMVFAPWCQHCHTMMPLFAAAARGRTAIMVNGDCMPDEVMAGQDCMPSVGYFPFLAVKARGTVTAVSSPEEAVTAYDAAAVDSAPPNSAPPDSVDEDAATDALSDSFGTMMMMAKRSVGHDMRRRPMDTASDGVRSREILDSQRGPVENHDFMNSLFS